MSANRDILEIATRILKSGKDRIPRIPDKRKLKKLCWHGLLIYPDGYSLTARAMEETIIDFRLIANEAEKYGNHVRAEEFRELEAKAKTWVAKHHVTPDVRKLRFGDIGFDMYHVLWEVVTKNGGEAVKELLPKRHLKSLLKRDYLKDGSIPMMVKPTTKGLDLVKEYGDPFLGIRRTAENVVERYKAANCRTH